MKLAKEEGIPEESANYFSMIETTVGKLDGFVQNIVNYYQNMKKGVLMVDTDLDLLVDGVFGTHRNFEASSSFEFVKEINTANPSYKLDELRMKMVLNNLVSNAIKYQDRTKDKQFININITNSEDNLVITAQDNGVGIDAESQEKVFDMFFRVAEDDMGSGIGLYIVKEAVEKMNGNIHLESTQGVGTTFKITIPLTHE
ncbi:MAG: HAMP domain-containing histidine kinase [Flavobacteriales bacterium]|nr:HAMP domain-containing histidine kinase [Flavobacteriales bacterium]